MVAESLSGYSQGWTWLPAETSMCITWSASTAPEDTLETVLGLCPIHKVGEADASASTYRQEGIGLFRHRSCPGHCLTNGIKPCFSDKSRQLINIVFWIVTLCSFDWVWRFKGTYSFIIATSCWNIILTIYYLNSSIFWDVILWIPHWHFRGTCHLCLQDWRVSKVRNQHEAGSKQSFRLVVCLAYSSTLIMALYPRRQNSSLTLLW
jgi:hypothetical protein